MRVSGRLWQVQAVAVTADASPSIRGPYAGPRRSGRGSFGLQLYPGFPSLSRYPARQPVDTNLVLPNRPAARPGRRRIGCLGSGPTNEPTLG